ncbi:hypothetical protein T484DRAFT_1766073 [Baffinella frigidus]|nr:hypothetical protein T484DRAFT_1766073 [Cryptophyta sp. CCMP2293]
MLEHQIKTVSLQMLSSDEEQGAEAARHIRAIAMEHREDDETRGVLGASDELRKGLLHLLSNGSDAARYWVQGAGCRV